MLLKEFIAGKKFILRTLTFGNIIMSIELRIFGYVFSMGTRFSPWLPSFNTLVNFMEKSEKANYVYEY